MFGVLAVAAVAGLAWRRPPPAATSDSAIAAQLALGGQLYQERCASCHGAKLEGQPDWRQRRPDGKLPAPPHDASGHTWHHSDRELFQITKHGLQSIVPGYQSDMPVFAGQLTDEEIWAVLAFIKSRWPERERQYQAERSKAAEAAGQ